MTLHRIVFCCATLALAGMHSSNVDAADYEVQVLEEAAPADELSDEVAAQLTSTGLRVLRGSTRTVCEIWPCSEWSVKADFEPSSELLYPFQPGQLIGVLRFTRRGSDFRDQTISRGVYTLRYGLQPVDGNHEGTSPTRDFLLLVHAENDTAVEPKDWEALMESSAEAAGSSHPAMLCLQAATSDADAPTMRHDEDRDWWILKFASMANSAKDSKVLPVELVVVGHADE
jgi:hypothetical protein